MPDWKYDWKKEITERVGDVDPSILEELAQHLEARFEETGSYDVVVSEWSADELRAALSRMKQRREAPAPGNPSGGLWQGIWQDLRYGLRQLRLNPGFASVAILSLALGVGANTAIFHLLDAVSWRALPVSKPDELATVRILDWKGGCCNFNGRYSRLTYPLWEQIRQQQQAFSSMFAWGTTTFDLAKGGEQRFAENSLWVSGEFFNVLGVRPILGRVFNAADDKRGCSEPGVVISHAFWQREFGGDRSIVGRTITLSAHPFPVIGVTQAGFFGIEVGRSYDLAVPFCAEAIIQGEHSHLDRRSSWWLSAVGRLKPGWTVARASTHFATISPGVFESTVPDDWNADAIKKYQAYKLNAFDVEAGFSQLRQQYEEPLQMLLAIAGLVLLIACANLANLMLARASGRQREIAIRLALGASRSRLIRQMLVESLLLAVAGTLFGALLARGASMYLVTFLSTDVNPLYVDLGMDWRLFAFLAALSVFTCLLFGLVPALRATRATPAAAMNAAGRSGTESREGFGLRRVLVVSQVALSLALLVGSLLFIRSLNNLLTLDAGFRQDGILELDYDLQRLRHAEAARLPFRQNLLERIRAIPGVEAAASVSNVPVSGNWWNDDVWMEGSARSKSTAPMFSRVSPGYFYTLGTPLVDGRDFHERDTMAGTLVAIVNESFTRKFTDGASPLGRRLFVDAGPKNPPVAYEIVGVVKDTKYSDLREAFKPIVFLSMSQEKHPSPDDQVLIRSQMPLGSLMTSVKQTVEEVNPGIAFHFHNFREQVRWTVRRERLMGALSGLFGLLAVTLAMAGLFGVMSYTVARRTHEIGVRMALGADRGRIAKMILGEAGRLLLIGLPLGAALAWYAVKYAEKMLYNLQPGDIPTFAFAAGTLTLVAVAASYLPARRAARVEPVVALRYE